MKREIKEITLLRATALVLLLATHVPDYVGDGGPRAFPYPPAFLAMFVFASGYCLALGKGPSDWRQVRGFLQRRFSRIGVLYVPAVLCFYMLYDRGADGIGRLVGNLLCVQQIAAAVAVPYPTLWFVGMIVPYYVLFAVGRYAATTSRRTSTVSWLSLAIVVGYGLQWVGPVASFVDSRLLFYLPSFAAGVLVAEAGYLTSRPLLLRNLVLPIGIVVAASVVWRAASAGIVPTPAVVLATLPLRIARTVMIPLMFVWCAQWICRGAVGRSKVVGLVAYSSFAAYLFHRPILHAARALLVSLGVSDPIVLTLIYWAAVIPFVVFPASYVLQSAADRGLRRPRVAAASDLPASPS